MPDSAYEAQLGSIIAPAREILKLTKADATVIATGSPRALLVGTAGTANVVDAKGNTCTAIPLQAGYNPIRISQLETGGTADDIWGLY